jgi:K+/H+ antiporter YhaU regulatory subunit KhtT
MRTVKISHEPLPGIGERFDLAARSGLAVTVVSERAGRKHLSIGAHHDNEPIVTVSLTRGEAAALASLLVGAHTELVPNPPH